MIKHLTDENSNLHNTKPKLELQEEVRREGAGLRKSKDHNNYICSQGGSKMWQTDLGV